MIDSPILYKRGTKGEIRIWFMQQDGDKHRTVSGIENGKLVESGWTICQPKNVGRSNETTSEKQAELEIIAEYTKKLSRGYFYNISDVDKVEFTKPMLAQDYAKVGDKIDDITDWWSNPKYDGARCIARGDGLWTRTGKPINSVPHIQQELEFLYNELPDLELDGELYNHDYRDNFNHLMSIIRKTNPTKKEIEASRVIQYWVYDIASEDGPYSERVSIIEELCKDLEFVKIVPAVKIKDKNHLDQLYGEYLEDGYEGQMVRRGDSPYEFKRSKYLLKRKEFITSEFKVLGVEEGLGNWSGAVKRFLFATEDGKPFGAGVRGKYGDLAALLTANKPDWATVRYFEPTPDGIPRFPVVVDYGYGIRED